MAGVSAGLTIAFVAAGVIAARHRKAAAAAAARAKSSADVTLSRWGPQRRRLLLAYQSWRTCLVASPASAAHPPSW